MLNERQPQPLDEDQILEPVDEFDPDLTCSPAEPLVRDVEGRLWRVRRRSPVSGCVPLLTLALIAPILVLAALLLVR